MRAGIKTRLERIERALPRPRPAAVQSAVPVLKRWLETWGIVREGKESLAERVARAMGISPAELRRQLSLRAVGSA
jgi:hypothetical protein